MRVPQLVGMTLADAEDAAKKIGMEINDKDASGDNRIVFAAGNWTVVSQEHPAGSAADPTDRYLYVDILKTSEAQKRVKKALAMDYHTNESRFIGTVTGYTDGNSIRPNLVVVDAVPVRLDMIWTFDASCIDPAGLDVAKAIAAKASELPIGSKVEVILSSEGKYDGFVHQLTSGGALEQKPPAGSVNEHLVSTGWWVPEGIDFNSADVEYGKATSYSVPGEYSDARKGYAPLIAAAANSARSSVAGGTGPCMAQARDYFAAAAASSAEFDRQLKERERELQRLIDSGAYRCRDGDGDGVCYER